MLGALILGVLPACGSTDGAEPVAANEARTLQSSTQASTSSTPVVSPELPLADPYMPQWVGQIMPAVAAGNGLSLVVWTEVVNSSPSSSPSVNVIGARVRASDGAVLDTQRIAIATTGSDEVFPAVAFDGTHFLVVWNANAIVYGARVRASDGAVLDAPRKLSVIEPNPYGELSHMYPSVASDGTNYLVVWSGYYYPGSGVPRPAIRGAWVRASDGQLVDTYSPILAVQSGAKPRVTYGGGRYMVVWSGSHYTASSEIWGLRLDAQTRQALNPLVNITSNSVDEDAPDVASDGNNFLVTWKRGTSLQQTRVRGSDGAVLDAVSTVGQSLVQQGIVTFDGRDYRVAWLSTRDGGLKLFLTRIPATGGAGAELTISALDSSSQSHQPGIAATGPGHLMALYVKDAPSSRLFARLVDDVQEDAPPDCTTLPPTLVINGGAQQILECGSAPYSDAGATAVDGCGNPLPVYAYNTGADASGPGPNTKAEGTYWVSYATWDNHGHSLNATRTVIVDDRVAPTLTLKGATRMTHTCGSQWKEPGYTGTDGCYGDLTPQVRFSGDVNGWAAGTYTVTYTLTDSGGNSATPVTRTVDVVNCPW
ncbi:immunoglobulin-like domain-containing protein [Hyalangium gracile]|uniref:immunoglobulin-like domain-containing protein n=1 Tax=Hyalangium gracile TaxID=394092 RepID=UPI001CCDA8C3|nr:DUF5011 domain-containing protein [Hyalangium gracile]